MSKQVNLKFNTDAARIEFWIVTGCIFTALLLSLYEIAKQNQQTSGILMPVLFSYIVTFVLYMLLSFYLAPAFESENKAPLNGSLLIFIFMALCYLVGIVSIYFTALLALKLLFIYFNRTRQNNEDGPYYEASLLTASWILITVGVLYLSTPLLLRFYLLYDIAAAIILYLYAVHIILPGHQTKHNVIYYFLRMLLYTLLSSVAVFLIGSCFMGSNIGLVRPASLTVLVVNIGNEENLQNLVLLNLFTQLFIVTPLSLSIYKRRNAKKQEEINVLKTELGQSDANLNLLKSQINPHFLFNALNTLYGTALQENAERTGEGIQKLGDMMRFMLDENLKDNILLARDIDYLKNYILLQELRTATSSSVIVESRIDEYWGDLIIAPMLLIPFVENAFKHGISLQNPSQIRVTLQIEGNKLYFDVHNSVHIQPDNDPEKGHSGIGLENVKQRLILLYPNRHDLIIRENKNEFFIHLTLQLAINN
jgi:two-component system LytT family sensor kinase